MLKNEIITGNCLEIMKTFPDNHFTGIVTDPPYMLNFMSKDFDKFENNPAKNVGLWKEALRIVKPGSHLLAFGGDRTHHHMMMAIENAGWEIRTCIYWAFGSGFPKSHNHFGIPGYGTALKPAVEIITIAMKPLDGTFKQNYEKWGIGGLNIDGCRINTTDNLNGGSYGQTKRKEDAFFKGKVPGGAGKFKQPKGRWPANLILDEESAALLDEQSGNAKPKKQREGVKGGSGFGYFDDKKTRKMKGTWPGDDGGGASRFFYCAKASKRERNAGCENFPVRGLAGSNKWMDVDYRIKENGERVLITGANNHHPCVKPLSLMRYLITLIAPPENAFILDPFAGSGSTIVAAEQLGIQAIGIEKEVEYAEIARARVAHTASKVQTVVDQMEMFN